MDNQEDYGLKYIDNAIFKINTVYLDHTWDTLLGRSTLCLYETILEVLRITLNKGCVSNKRPFG